MKIQYYTRALLAALFLLILVGGCGKKDPEFPPIDESSGAPLVPLPCGSYRTFSQIDWDAPATDGPSPGTYRDRNWNTAFPQGLVVGIVEPGKEYLRFTSPEALRNFLPQTGPPAPLVVGAENPPAGQQFSSFAGEVVALKMNLYYDDYEHRLTPLRTGKQLRYLTLASGPFQNVDVERLLALAERTLGGDPARSTTLTLYNGNTQTFNFTVEQLNEAIKLINENFASGTANKGFLNCT
jgi:hypothetical protein